LVPSIYAQNQRSAADIIRQGQERQQAIEKAGQDLQRGVQEIFEREQRRHDEEREQRAREREQQQEERREREAERQRQQDQLEDFRRSMEQQAESQRQLQENINRTLQQGRVASQATPESSTATVNNGVIKPEVPASATANALPGTPNESAVPRKDWGPWQHVSQNIWVSYCKVSNKFDNGRPLWTWALKNWNDQTVKTVWFEYLEDGQWRKDLTPFSLKPRDGHGGWASFTAVGNTPPSIRITQVELK
jgi:hypothetical protein